MLGMRDLEQFLAVVENGSILQAAEASGIAQPALSRRIRLMEESLGVPLFVRGARGTTPTVHGRLLAKHAELILGDRQRALRELTALRDGIDGHARIGVGPSFSSLLAKAIASLTERRPGLTFDVTYATFDELVQRVLDGDIDAAFSLIADERIDGDVLVKVLHHERVELVCGQEHPLRRKRKISLADLANERWALMNRPRAVIDVFRRTARERGVPAPKVSVETNSLELVKELVREGGCITVLPRGAVASDLDADRLATLPIPDLPEFRSALIYRQDVLPPAIELLADEVQALQDEAR